MSDTGSSDASDGFIPAEGERIPVVRPGGRRGSAFDIVVIASSAGGIAALTALLAALPPAFPLPILICQHVSRDGPSMLASVLSHRTGRRVIAGEEGLRPTPGSIHVAPSNRHLLMRPDGALGLSDQERINFCRPAADVLFRSAAAVHGSATIGVVLTGFGRDGAMGSRSIQRAGGFVICQTLEDAEVHEMPMAARDIGGADLVLPLGEIAPALDVLARGARDGPERASAPTDRPIVPPVRPEVPEPDRTAAWVQARPADVSGDHP